MIEFVWWQLKQNVFSLQWDGKILRRDLEFHNPWSDPCGGHKLLLCNNKELHRKDTREKDCVLLKPCLLWLTSPYLLSDIIYNLKDFCPLDKSLIVYALYLHNRGWDGWMASPTQWTWVWVNSGSWWWTGRPGVLQSMGSQRVGHDWATELNWTYT